MFVCELWSTRELAGVQWLLAPFCGHFIGESHVGGVVGGGLYKPAECCERSAFKSGV